MTGDADPSRDVFGSSIAAAADTLSDRTGRDRPDVEAALRTVSDDGVVTASTVDDAVGDASLALSTAEGRVERAAVEIETTREALVDSPSVDYLDDRLSVLNDRYDSLIDEQDRLQSILQRVVEDRDDPSALYAVATDLQRVESGADALQGRADQLAAEAGDLQRTVESPPLVAPDIEADLDALGTAFDETASAVTEIADARADQHDRADAWLETWARHRSRRLALADVRAELDAIEQLGADDETASLRGRLDDLAERWEAIDGRLVDAAPAPWVEANEQRMGAVERALEGFEPPIDWGAVEERLDEALRGDDQ